MPAAKHSQLHGVLHPAIESIHTLVRVNVLIMLALLGLRARGVYRAIRKRLAFPQTSRDLDPMHRAGRLVLLPRGPGDVPTDNGLDREDLELAHLHAPVLEDRAERRGDLRREIEGQEVCAQRGDGFGEDLEPRLRAEGEEDAFIGDSLVDMVRNRTMDVMAVIEELHCP